MYIFLADNFFLVKINVEKDLFVGDIGEVEGFWVETNKHGFFLVHEEVGLSFLGQTLIIDEVVVSLLPELVSFDVAYQNKLSVFGLVDLIPLFGQQFSIIYVLHFKYYNICQERSNKSS